MGFKSVKLFVEKMKLTLHQVENHYATLFDGSPTLGLPGSLVFTGGEDHPDTLKTLCKQLKQRCGVGGAVKGDTLEIQGDQRSACQEHLEKMGYEVKLSGG